MPRGIYKRKPFTEKHRINLSESHKGKKMPPMTEEAKRNISKAKKGNPSGRLGEKFTKEHCKKISEAKKRYKFTEEHKNNISIAIKGKKYSVKFSGENSPRWKGGKKENNKRYYDKHKNDLKTIINNRMRCGIGHSLKIGTKNGNHWEFLVPYTYKQLEIRLKSTIPKEYTWKDFLSCKLEIDHIIPINAFNFEKPEDFDFKRCWALSNLRLLPAKENMIKHNKLIKPFQLGLVV